MEIPLTAIRNRDRDYRTVKKCVSEGPLDRFLSGFLDKCVKQLYQQNHCEPLPIFSDNEMTLVEDFQEDQQKLFEIYVDTMPLTWDVHLFPQALNCGGLFQTYQNYDFVGSMGEHFYHDLGRFSDEYPLLKPFLHKVFRVYGKENVTNNQGVETKAASKRLDFYTPHTVRVYCH
jgi:hypothetical protein